MGCICSLSCYSYPLFSKKDSFFFNISFLLCDVFVIAVCFEIIPLQIFFTTVGQGNKLRHIFMRVYVRMKMCLNLLPCPPIVKQQQSTCITTWDFFRWLEYQHYTQLLFQFSLDEADIPLYTYTYMQKHKKF